jgi:hypothetical protein
VKIQGSEKNRGNLLRASPVKGNEWLKLINSMR